MASVLASLLGQTSITDHEEVLKAADAALNKSKGDVEAQHVKVVALLKLDRFEDALRVVETGGDKLKARARLEWAYALYKAGQPGKAAEVAKEVGGLDARGMRHVEAQASYRDEDFASAAELYGQLSAASGDAVHEDMDLRINSGAVDAQLEWSGKGHLAKTTKPAREDLEAFETAYNAACGSIARDELGQAEVLLRRAKDLCNALEDLSDEDKHTEILPITVQHSYVLLSQGRVEEASSLLASVSVKDITESSTYHVAQTNSNLASSEPVNPYLSHRLIHKSPSEIRPDRPFSYQSAAMQRNNYALDLLAQKYSGIIESTVSAISKAPSPTLDPTVNSLAAVNAAAHAHGQAGKQAIKSVLPVLERRPNDVGLLLVVIQLYVVSGNPGAAISILEAFFARLSASEKPSVLDVRYAPGLVATAVSLYSARGQLGHARLELARASRHWRQSSQNSTAAPAPKSLSHLYKTAGAALLQSNDIEDQTLASEIFSDLCAADPEDRYSNAGLVASLALANPSAIQSANLSSLTPVERLTAGIDLSALESSGIAKPITANASTAVKRPAEPQKEVKKAKKLRATKMPKDFDPNKKMDPERWLPLKDRSNYRPKGKKGKAKQSMLTQGGVVDESKDANGSGPGTPVGELAKSSGPQNKNKKKKGKGGKW